MTAIRRSVAMPRPIAGMLALLASSSLTLLASTPLTLLASTPAVGKTIVSCGGAALLGGVELVCSHVDPTAPPQICTFSWALATPTNQTQVVEGSFLIPPGTSNFMAYQGSGFSRALSEPIVLCQGRRSGR
jgi:hypothetical protein